MKINITQKKHKGKISNIPLINQDIRQNSLKLISISGGRINKIQYDSMLHSLRQKIKVKIKIIEKISVNYPVTAKTLETRMGKGKGAFDHYVAKIRPNKVLLEVFTGQSGIDYKEILRLVGMKLPIRSKIL